MELVHIQLWTRMLLCLWRLLLSHGYRTAETSLGPSQYLKLSRENVWLVLTFGTVYTQLNVLMGE